MDMNGPVNISRSERLQTCHEIAARLHEVYRDKILAIGIYDSLPKVLTALSRTLKCFVY